MSTTQSRNNKYKVTKGNIKSIRGGEIMSHHLTSKSKDPENNNKTKHWFCKELKHHDKTSRKYFLEGIILDSLLSRTLHKADETGMTPKTKIIKDTVSVSRLYNLDGKQEDTSVLGHDLFDYLGNRYKSERRKGKRPEEEESKCEELEGVLKAVIDSIIIQRWDSKPENYTAPKVRPFDLGYSLSNLADYFNKWDEETIRSIIKGTSVSSEEEIIHIEGNNDVIVPASEDKIPEDIEGSIDGIALALTQTFAFLGTRANKHEGYAKNLNKSRKDSYTKIISQAIKSDLEAVIAKKGGEISPSMALLELFEERAQKIEDARTSEEKNPREEVEKEIERIEEDESVKEIMHDILEDADQRFSKCVEDMKEIFSKLKEELQEKEKSSKKDASQTPSRRSFSDRIGGGSSQNSSQGWAENLEQLRKDQKKECIIL
ncbi:hypothetical protein N9W34_03130 [Rickettsiales bacterium]|nr:hypothetical protein [Rickettsiales bacterium]